jgi:NAD(P)-dependent dehydrogenase (short-subunit alcohol dehydrogenase family)
MPSLTDAKRSNAAYKPSYPGIPVAVFVGGTSGIGQAIAQLFTSSLSGRAHIILVGRNEAAATRILDSLPTSGSTGEPAVIRQFIPFDFLELSNVKTVITTLLNQVQVKKINYLILSAGYANPLQAEGQILGSYYHRFKFIHESLPLLQKARDLGEDARVMTVLAAGAAPLNKVDLKDFINGNRDYGWKSGAYATIASAVYTDYALDVCLSSPALHGLLL